LSIRVFTEKEVNSAVLKKVPYEYVDKRKTKHVIIRISINGYLVGPVRVPNPHSKGFTKGKASALASKLELSPEQYNLFIKCDFSKEDYLKHLKKKAGIK
jgi:hypothetical protein